MTWNHRDSKENEINNNNRGRKGEKQTGKGRKKGGRRGTGNNSITRDMKIVH